MTGAAHGNTREDRRYHGHLAHAVVVAVPGRSGGLPRPDGGVGLGAGLPPQLHSGAGLGATTAHGRNIRTADRNSVELAQSSHFCRNCA